MRYSYGNTLGELMAWTELLKNDESTLTKRKVQYSGTCPKCKKFVSGGEFCPIKLPAQGDGLSASTYCPMKVTKAGQVVEDGPYTHLTEKERPR